MEVDVAHLWNALIWPLCRLLVSLSVGLMVANLSYNFV